MSFKDQKRAKEYHKEYNHKRYLANKQEYRDKTAKKKKENAIWLLKYKTNLTCGLCGENDFRCLDFHHIESIEKTADISVMVNNGCSIKRIESEISKCQVLCANCHRKKHYKHRMIG